MPLLAKLQNYNHMPAPESFLLRRNRWFGLNHEHKIASFCTPRSTCFKSTAIAISTSLLQGATSLFQGGTAGLPRSLDTRALLSATATPRQIAFHPIENPWRLVRRQSTRSGFSEHNAPTPYMAVTRKDWIGFVRLHLSDMLTRSA
jgi:hypothetical protein